MAAKKKKSRAKAPTTRINRTADHPMIAAAGMTPEQRARARYEVAHVTNPMGEVIIRGELKRHKAVRRVPHFETLYRARVIDRHVFACLEWYAARAALASAGMFKCGLNTAGGSGGSAATHIPTTELTMMARSDLDWADSFIPADLLPAFRGVMVDGDNFEIVGRAIWPDLSIDTARRRASSAFKIAANRLLLGIGDKVIGRAGK